MSHSFRAASFRRGVYQHKSISTGCKVLLLYLSERANAQGRVSVPRSQLAGALAVAPTRITEWISAARKAGFVDTIEQGKPGTTAVYHLLVLGTESGPHKPDSMVRKSFPTAWSGIRTSKTDMHPESPAQLGTDSGQPTTPQAEVSEQERAG